MATTPLRAITSHRHTRMDHWQHPAPRPASTPMGPAICSRPAPRARTTGSTSCSLRPVLPSRSTTMASRPQKARRSQSRQHSFCSTTQIRTAIRFRWLRLALSWAGRSALPRMLSLSRRHLAISALQASPIRSRTAPTPQCPPPSSSPSCRRRQRRNYLHTRTPRRTSPTQTRPASILA